MVSSTTSKRLKVSFLEPPAVTERSAERFAGCTFELYHFPDLANLYPFTILHQRGVEVDFLDAGLLGDTQETFLERLKASPSDSSLKTSWIITSASAIYLRSCNRRPASY